MRTMTDFLQPFFFNKIVLFRDSIINRLYFCVRLYKTYFCLIVFVWIMIAIALFYWTNKIFEQYTSLDTEIIKLFYEIKPLLLWFNL